ncbi:hypothetical protein QE152_g15592 [Popillia japonica]|uniref:Uncharacterized protein n=1 Tax=Popillia japonica TaxID=7064 RepID=A0AAW1L8I3_POPJA
MEAIFQRESPVTRRYTSRGNLPKMKRGSAALTSVAVNWGYLKKILLRNEMNFKIKLILHFVSGKFKDIRANPSTMWQDDDLLTSPTFKLIGETANTPLKAPQRRNSLPSPKELADLGGLETKSVSTEKHPSKRKRQESPSDVQSEIDDKRTVIEKFLGREQLKQTPLLDQCRWRNQRDTYKGEATEAGINEELRKGTEKLVKTIRELVQITEASAKTKVEIKNLVKKLKRQADDVDKELQETAKQVKLKPEQLKQEMKSVAVQTVPSDMENAYVERRIETVNKIKAVLEENGDFDSLASVLDEKWPKEIYKSTELQATTKAATTGYQGDHAILMDPTNMHGNKMVEKLMLKYNGLAELIRRNEGEVDFLIQTARTKTRN